MNNIRYPACCAPNSHAFCSKCNNYRAPQCNCNGPTQNCCCDCNQQCCQCDRSHRSNECEKCNKTKQIIRKKRVKKYFYKQIVCCVEEEYEDYCACCGELVDRCKCDQCKCNICQNENHG
ncbi:hypothetical protein GJ496_003418 [Pomphorhynchus laevis]|nr:hypothetical protein GJ496_003418 [Pomphorhynchus laevis]